MRPGDCLTWAIRHGASPEVAAEVEEAWLGDECAHPLARALIMMREDATSAACAPEVRRWSEMASMVALSLLSVRP